MKPLLIGQAPARTGTDDRALGGRAGRRLARLAGITLDEFLARLDMRNLLNAFPGATRKGDLFPVPLARARAEILKAEEIEREVLVFVGIGVARAFKFEEPPCVWRRIAFPRRRIGMIPHPSGVSLWYNDAERRAEVGRFLRDAIGLM